MAALQQLEVAVERGKSKEKEKGGKRSKKEKIEQSKSSSSPSLFLSARVGKKTTYLPKTVHFELPARAARNQCCRLDNNARHDPCPVCVEHGLGEWGERRYRAEWRDAARQQFLLVPPTQSRRSKR